MTELMISQFPIETDAVYSDPRFTELTRIYAQLLGASWEHPADILPGEHELVVQMMRDCTDTFAIEEGGKVVGAAVVDIQSSAVWLESLVVDENLRCRGLGMRALAAIETEVRARGCGVMKLASTKGAQSLYVRSGYTRDPSSGPMARYYKPLLD